MAHLRAVPDPDDVPDDDAEMERVVEPIDPAAAVSAGEDVEPADGHDAEAELARAEEERRYPSTIGGAFYLSILAVAGTALFIAARTDWRLGIQMLGGSLLIAALLRLVLANRDAGMLAVRHRVIDVVLLIGTGVALIALATSIPDMPA